MPIRKDFETHFENEAELLIADMNILPDEPPAEKELKLKILESYNHKLDKRERLLAFVYDKDFVNSRNPLTAMERARSKEEKELFTRYRCLARFHNVNDHQKLLDGILQERKIRSQISHLQMWRRQGITTRIEGESSDLNRHQKGSNNNNSNNISNNNINNNLNNINNNLNNMNLMNMGGNIVGNIVGNMGNIGEDGFVPSSSSSNQIIRGKGRPSGTSAAQLAQQQQLEAALTQRGNRWKERSLAVSTNGGKNGKQRSIATEMSIDDKPSVELLSINERNLCRQVHLLPDHYLYLKEVLLREYSRLGVLKRGYARQLLGIDPSIATRVYDFFTQVGIYINIYICFIYVINNLIIIIKKDGYHQCKMILNYFLLQNQK